VEQYLRKLGRKADMYSSSSSVKERARMIAGFQDEKDSEGNFVIRDQEQRPDFLVGTLEMLNDCLQLTRAFRLVLFSPDIDFGKMTQAEKREHRIGQKNPKTYTYIFYNSDSTIDVAILETSGIIAMIIGRVLSTSADELDGKVVVIRD
jgi:SNF2 family DNA or RNA helicase